jgi:GrpB-like predicted nucleotidyltransferase (UPF0157 family)
LASIVEVVPYDERWPEEFRRVAAELRERLGERALRVDHIGSTAVPGLPAKDRIDVQVAVAALDPIEGFEPFVDHVPPGARPDGWEKLFGRTERANLHVRVEGAPNQRYALLFRDYLRASPPARDAYGEFKRRLAGYRPIPTADYADIKDPVCDVVMAGAEAWAAAVGWAPGPSDA